MRNKHTASPPAMIGAVSLITVFAVLCLVVFALLSLSTVQADQRLSDRSARAITDYYAADCAAEGILAQLRSGKIPDGVTDCGGGRYRYSCPIGETQVLAVDVTIEGADYTVLRWQAVSTAEWEADDTISVWDGETMQEE